jgi:L,D-peptidoglycan transpeptidase YkuD (ErfK/YbiS/YcfS/YnhG family)
MGWCDDIYFSKKYNKLIKTKKKIKHEKLSRRDHKYDLLIPIKYNFKKPISGLGSCIFIHLTKNYKPTAGCIALKKKDFLIMLKLIKKQTKIKIF